MCLDRVSSSKVLARMLGLIAVGCIFSSEEFLRFPARHSFPECMSSFQHVDMSSFEHTSTYNIVSLDKLVWPAQPLCQPGLAGSKVKAVEPNWIGLDYQVTWCLPFQADRRLVGSQTANANCD